MLPCSGVWLSLLIAAAAATDVGAGADMTVSAGVAPIAPGEPSEPAVALDLVPTSLVRVRSRRQMLELRYHPHIHWRQPNLLGMSLPLLLHRALLRFQRLQSRRTTWDLSGSGAIGSLSYASLAQALDEPQSSRLRVAVARIASVGGSASLTTAQTRRSTLRLQLSGDWLEPLDDDIELSSRGRVGFMATQGYRLSPVDTLSFPVSVGYARLSGGLRYLAASAAAGWEGRLTRVTLANVSAGITAARPLDQPAQSFVFPIGRAGLEGLLWARDGHHLTGRMATFVSTTLDPIEREYLPVAGLTGGLRYEPGARWSAGIQASVSTLAASRPRQPGYAETIMSFTAPVHRRLARGWMLRFGLEGRTRASHPTEPLELVDYELWTFVGVSWLISTDRSDQ